MTHGLEKRSPQLPLGIEVLYSYSTVMTGSDHIAVSLRNTTDDWVLIDKGVPIARMEAANLLPPVTAEFITSKPQTQKTISGRETEGSHGEAGSLCFGWLG